MTMVCLSAHRKEAAFFYISERLPTQGIFTALRVWYITNRSLVWSPETDKMLQKLVRQVEITAEL